MLIKEIKANSDFTFDFETFFNHKRARIEK